MQYAISRPTKPDSVSEHLRNYWNTIPIIYPPRKSDDEWMIYQQFRQYYLTAPTYVDISVECRVSLIQSYEHNQTELVSTGVIPTSDDSMTMTWIIPAWPPEMLWGVLQQDNVV